MLVRMQKNQILHTLLEGMYNGSVYSGKQFLKKLGVGWRDGEKRHTTVIE